MTKIQRVATSAFIYHNGKALIAQRASDEPFLPNHWENVGGSLEWGEEPEAGLIREVQEEAGITVTPITPYSAHHYMHEDKDLQIIEIAYICDPGNNPQVKLSHEHQDFKWIHESELTDIMPMTEDMRNLIAKGFQEYKNLATLSK